MSDRVGYMVGNTRNRDHINWPTILRSEIPTRTAVDPLQVDTVWPVDITLDQAMAMAWRVKKWRFTGQADIALSTTGASITGHLDISDDSFMYPLDNANQKASRERDLVGQLFGVDPFAALVNGSVTIPDDGSQIYSVWSTHDILITLGGDFSGSEPLAPRIFGSFVLFDPDTGLFTPDFYGPGTVIPNGPSINQLSVNIVFRRNPQTILSGVGPLLLKAPGVTHVISGVADSFDVPMEISWRFLGEGPTIHNGTATADFTLQAEEWWPCSDSSGDPVYDQFSGEQLRDPFG